MSGIRNQRAIRSILRHWPNQNTYDHYHENCNMRWYLVRTNILWLTRNTTTKIHENWKQKDITKVKILPMTMISVVGIGQEMTIQKTKRDAEVQIGRRGECNVIYMQNLFPLLKKIVIYESYFLKQWTVWSFQHSDVTWCQVLWNPLMPWIYLIDWVR